MQSTPSTYIYRGYPSRPIPVPPLIDRGYATGPLQGSEFNAMAVFNLPAWVKLTKIDETNRVTFVKPAWYEHPMFLGALVAVIATEALNLGVSAYKRRRSQRTSR